MLEVKIRQGEQRDPHPVRGAAAIALALEELERASLDLWGGQALFNTERPGCVCVNAHS